MNNLSRIFFLRFLILVCVSILILIPLLAFAQDEEEGLEEALRVYKHGDGGEKIVALTFDDGPKPEFSNEVLDILDRYGIKATFFVVGKEVKAHPDMLMAIYQRGHDIGNHSYSHISAKKLTLAEIAAELKKTNAIIKQITGLSTKYFRAPGGWYNIQVLQEVHRQGLKEIDWSINSSDYTTIVDEFKVEMDYDDLAQKVYDRVIKKIHPGAVILFHNGSIQTIRALPRIIKAIKDKGYGFVTISDMMRTKR